MALIFYPHIEDMQKGSLEDRIELLISSAEKYKAITLDTTQQAENTTKEETKRIAPRDLQTSYNWEEIAAVLREAREMPELNVAAKNRKGDLFTKLIEIYEVLRAAKMPKLEAVRLALTNEKEQITKIT